MRKILFLLCVVTFASTLHAQETRREVMFMTNKGNIRVALYNETPKHRDNFLKLVSEGFYDGVLFHRVINRFMIQAGDPESRHAQSGQMLGGSSEKYTVPAEIVYPKLFHKRGALAAAREGDRENPTRASSSSQFYIVYGRLSGDQMLDRMQERISQATGGTAKMTPEIRETYKTIGGTPHLDGQYTVFGEVIEGLDVVEDIEFVPTDENDRPKEDVRIIRAMVMN